MDVGKARINIPKQTSDRALQWTNAILDKLAIKLNASESRCLAMCVQALITTERNEVLLQVEQVVTELIKLD